MWQDFYANTSSTRRPTYGGHLRWTAAQSAPYPTREAMEAIAKEVGAPDWTKIDSFYKNMHVKHQEEYQ